MVTEFTEVWLLSLPKQHSGHTQGMYAHAAQSQPTRLDVRHAHTYPIIFTVYNLCHVINILGVEDLIETLKSCF
jgi:hypothetical protein